MKHEAESKQTRNVGDVVLRISYIGEQTKPVRSVLLATSKELIPDFGTSRDELRKHGEVVVPETCVVEATEMHIILEETRVFAARRPAVNRRRFFRVTITQNAAEAPAVEVTLEQAADFLERVRTAVFSHNTCVKRAIERLARETNVPA
jgi:hypothetical protein